jgi:hypothetical protein
MMPILGSMPPSGNFYLFSKDWLARREVGMACALCNVHPSSEGKAMHSGEFDRDSYRRSGPSDGLERGGAWALEFLRNRTADQWLMFLAGIVIGMIIG